MWRAIFFCVLSVSLFACKTDENKLYDEFKEADVNGWKWNDARSFTFEITDSSYLYDLECGLRITGGYKYSNIWLLYTIEGNGITKKNQFDITLSDNTGKWLGKGMSNLLSYKKVFLHNVPLKPGKYTIRFTQNMWDEKLESVSDIGLKVYKTTRVY